MMKAEQPLSGRTALVTGASGDIGRGIALSFAQAGASLVLHCHTSIGKGEETLARVKALGRDAILLQADLAEASQAEDLARKALRHFPAIDILVNNAGSSGFAGPVTGTPVEEWDRLIRTNLSSAFYLCRLLVPGMIERKFGRVINISSIGYRRALPGMASYLASKAALNAFTRALSKETASHGVTVNAIAPGQVSTERVMKVRLPGLSRSLDQSVEEIQQQMLRDSDTRRFTTVEEVAGLALFLASADLPNLTGEIIDLAGGL